MTYEEAIEAALNVPGHSVVYITEDGFEPMHYDEWIRSDVHPFALAWNSWLDREDNALLLRDAKDWQSGEYR